MDTDRCKESQGISQEDTDTAVVGEEKYEFAEEDPEPELEPEGLIFYHTDLYDSQGRLKIFPEDLNMIQEATIHDTEAATESWELSPEQIQLNFQKEVDDLAKQYGLSEDKDEEEILPFFTHMTFKKSDPSLSKSTNPYAQKTVPFHQKQNTTRDPPAQIPSVQGKVEREGHVMENMERQHKDSKLNNDEEGALDNKKQKDGLFENNGNQVDECHRCENTNLRKEDPQDRGEERTEDQPDQDNFKDVQPKPIDKAAADPDGINMEEGPEISSGHGERSQGNVLADPNEKQDSMTSRSQIKEESEVPEPPDIFCITCKTPVRAFEKLFGFHKEHDVMQMTAAVENLKEEMHKNVTKLEEQIVQMENFAGHLEEIFITIDETCTRQEQNFEMHFSDIMDALAQKHEDKVQALGVEKKLKLESLFEQLVECGKSLDTSKILMETVQDLFRGKEKAEFVKIALDATNRLNEYFNKDIDLNISANAEFKNNRVDFSEAEQLLDSINTIPAPSAPVINPQTPNSATATSLRVCWSLFSEDTVGSYQLYYKPVSDGTPGEDQEECMIRAKETYCTVKELMPNTQYEFWVTAINVTGGSPASERAVYVTAPGPPIIKGEESSSCENAALICWESGNINPVDSYTVEIYKVTNGVNDVLPTESIVGIPICECLIQLQPRETYHISVRAVNVGGPSETSKSISVHTTGTFFHLNQETAHPLLSISNNGFMISCKEEESLADLPYTCNSFTRCIAVMGNLIPYKGKHYWEVEVEEHTQYRVGIAYEDTNKNGLIGGNNTSWCFRHVLTPARHKYEFLHCGMSPDIRVTVPPSRIGILLDYDQQKLSFFNMEINQHLYTFDCHFQHLLHPCFALEKPGSLKIHNGIPIPHSLNLF